MSISHQDRRHLGTAELVTELADERLMQRQSDGDVYRDFPLETIREVRLTVEMAAQANQVVCRVKDEAGSEIVFGSMAFKSPGVFESRIETFQPLLRALHLALLPHADKIRFIEGQSQAFMIAMLLLGVALTGIGAFFFVILLLIQENLAGLFMIAPFAAGLWVMQLFWPRGVKFYDPIAFAKPEGDPE